MPVDDGGGAGVALGIVAVISGDGSVVVWLGGLFDTVVAPVSGLVDSSFKPVDGCAGAPDEGSGTVVASGFGASLGDGLRSMALASPTVFGEESCGALLGS